MGRLNVTGHHKWLSVIDLRTHSIPSITYIILQGVRRTHTHQMQTECRMPTQAKRLYAAALCIMGRLYVDVDRLRAAAFSKYGTSSRGAAARPPYGLARACSHLHLASPSLTRTSFPAHSSEQRPPALWTSERWRKLQSTPPPPLQGFVFHSPVGLLGVVYTDSQRGRGEARVLKNTEQEG